MRSAFGIVAGCLVTAPLAQPARLKWQVDLDPKYEEAVVSGTADGAFVVLAYDQDNPQPHSRYMIFGYDRHGTHKWTVSRPYSSANLTVKRDGSSVIFGTLGEAGRVAFTWITKNGIAGGSISHPMGYYEPQKVTGKLAEDGTVVLAGKTRQWQGETMGWVLKLHPVNGYAYFVSQPSPLLREGAEILGVAPNGDCILQCYTGSEGYPVRMRDGYHFRQLEFEPFSSLHWQSDAESNWYRAGSRDRQTGYLEKIDSELNPMWARTFPTNVEMLKKDPWGNLVTLLSNGDIIRVRPGGELMSMVRIPYEPGHRSVMDLGLDKYGRHYVLSKASPQSILYFGEPWNGLRWSLGLGEVAQGSMVVHGNLGEATIVVRNPVSSRLSIQRIEQASEPVADFYSTAPGTSLNGNVLTNDRYALGAQALLLVQSKHGRVTMAIDGTFAYEPAPGYTGFDQFTYRVDKPGLASAAGVCMISVAD